MKPSPSELAATICFALALLHTFSVAIFQKLAHASRKGSLKEKAFHVLGEIELVFAVWAGIFLFVLASIDGPVPASDYFRGLNFNEPAFVFVILAVCSTAPILRFAENLITITARFLPLSKPMGFFLVALILGPLLGSLITEPAAMTVVALILMKRFYSQKISESLKYGIIGLLFVNISVGGTLTSFAAPPVLMVAGPWNWDSLFMLKNFGWRGALACIVSAIWFGFYFRREISALAWSNEEKKIKALPLWLYLAHILFLGAIVFYSHHPVFFLPIFALFFVFFRITARVQDKLSLREGLLVGLFLAGLVILGGPQKWWLQPLLMSLPPDDLFWGTTILTAITDNAALTYLAAQVPDLGELAKLAVVSGAVVGGGLTVVANAPNPAGYGILNPAFSDGIKPLRLLWAALPPTVIASICFWLI